MQLRPPPECARLFTGFNAMNANHWGARLATPEQDECGIESGLSLSSTIDRISQIAACNTIFIRVQLQVIKAFVSITQRSTQTSNLHWVRLSRPRCSALQDQTSRSRLSRRNRPLPRAMHGGTNLAAHARIHEVDGLTDTDRTNADLDPVPRHKRKWGVTSFLAYWISDAFKYHSHHLTR